MARTKRTPCPTNRRREKNDGSGEHGDNGNFRVRNSNVSKVTVTDCTVREKVPNDSENVKGDVRRIHVERNFARSANRVMDG